MKTFATIAAALAVAGCAHTSVNGIEISRRHSIALTAASIGAAALILTAEREQDAEPLDQGIPEHGCEACTIERLPGPVPGED